MKSIIIIYLLTFSFVCTFNLFSDVQIRQQPEMLKRMEMDRIKK